MKNKLSLIVTIITISIFLFTSVGYAIFSQRIGFKGNVTFKAGGEIAITNAILSSYSNLTNPQNPTFDKDSITFDLTFNVESNDNLDDDYKAVYEITLSNASFFDYEFASAVFNPDVETLNNQDMTVSYDIEGIEMGEIIPRLTTRTFTLIINMYPKIAGEYTVGGNSNVNVEEEETQEPTGSLLASIPKNSSVNLRNGNVRDSVTLTVANTYDTAQSFTLSINNSNFKIVDSNGNDLGNLTVPANTTQSYNVYFEIKPNVKFATDSQTTNLTFFKNGGNINLGSVKILVDKDETLLDSDAPIISDVNATFVREEGRINLTWSATDVNNIDYFIVEVYDDTDTLIKTINTDDGSRNCAVSGLTNGTYYFKVYGVDSRKNNGKKQATSCTNSEGKCSRSTSSSYKWVFTVTYSLDSYTTKTGGPTSVVIDQKLEATFNIGNRRYDEVTTKMGGNTLTSGNNGYTWSESNNKVTINKVTGDVEIKITTRSSACLVEGTKILLSNGKYKNIENITYNDLISAWSYDHGSITYEYPIWIEKKAKASRYQKTTFSDGSELKTYGYHGVFSPTYNEFISVDDTFKFKVGTEIYKVENGKLKRVKIVKIEQVNEEINYYHVVSSRYYNIIANDFLTTDGTVILSNLYGFDNNVTWPKEIRNKIINDKSKLYEYSEFEDIMPYYMFNGLRAEEGKYLNNFGLDKDTFKYYLINNQLNEDMILKVPTNNNGKRLWMVTNSNDDILNLNDYLYEEGSYYILPKVFGVNKWYSTSENKYYNPLDKVKINHSMHFIAN